MRWCSQKLDPPQFARDHFPLVLADAQSPVNSSSLHVLNAERASASISVRGTPARFAGERASVSSSASGASAKIVGDQAFARTSDRGAGARIAGAKSIKHLRIKVQGLSTGGGRFNASRAGRALKLRSADESVQCRMNTCPFKGFETSASHRVASHISDVYVRHRAQSHVVYLPPGVAYAHDCAFRVQGVGSGA